MRINLLGILLGIWKQVVSLYHQWKFERTMRWICRTGTAREIRDVAEQIRAQANGDKRLLDLAELMDTNAETLSGNARVRFNLKRGK